MSQASKTVSAKPKALRPLVAGKGKRIQTILKRPALGPCRLHFRIAPQDAQFDR
jgi:hypothetical protein